MAVSATEPAASTATTEPSATTAMRPPPAAEARDFSESDWIVRLRLMRTAFVLFVCFELIYFLVDIGPTPALGLHSVTLLIAALVLAATTMRWFARRWRPIAFAALSLAFALTAALTLMTGKTEPLLITVALGLVGTAATMPWSTICQAALTITGAGAMAVPMLASQVPADQAAYSWFGLLIAAALGHFIVAAAEHHRAEIARWAKSVQTGHEQLRQSESKLRRVLEASGDAISINRLSDGRYLDFNQCFCEISGYKREEALGRTALELGLWLDRDQLRTFMRRLRAERQVRNMECIFHMKDGRAVPYLLSAALMELDGEECIVAAARNISQLKQSEQDLRSAYQTLAAQIETLNHSRELLRAEIAQREAAQRRMAESEARFRRVFESSLDAICIIDLAGWRILDCNSDFFRMVERRRKDVVGHTIAELDVWISERRLREVTELVLSMGVVRNLEVEFRRPGGGTTPCLLSAVISEIDGRPCLLAFSRDISHLKRTQRELIAAREAALAASQAKSEFLSSMSHEIRTPMNAILGMADLLWETPLSAEQRRYLHTMRANGASLLALVDDVLDLAKIESGRLGLERSEFSLVELAESVMETLGIRAHEKGLELALHIRPGVPTALVGDPLRLRQILVNLVGNAIKFTERGEVVIAIEVAAPPAIAEATEAATVDADDRGPNGAEPAANRVLLRFAVRDTGIGIPAEKLETIFSSFTQGDSTTTRKYGGSGLGLAIVKRLVELKGGRIRVESRPGVGSTFSFIVPFDVRPGAPAVEQLGAAHSLAGARLLIADGTPAGRAVAAEMLELAGAAVDQAPDGAAAIGQIDRARAAGRPYDVVLADCRIPASDALGHHVRADDGEALVVMLTADDLPARFARLRAAGFGESHRCRHLFKPIRRAELLAVVAAARAGGLSEAASLGYHDGGANGGGDSSEAPAPSAPLPASEGAMAQTCAVPLRRPRRILLAEDSFDNRLVIEGYLRNTPYSLDYAADGKAAVRKATSESYDAILMDLQMPVMDGYAAVSEIRRWERENHRSPTPIIALTASTHEEAARRSLEMGCNSRVTKPVKRPTLLKALDDALEPHGAEKAATQPEAPAQPGHIAPGSSSIGAPSSFGGGDCADSGEIRGRIVVHVDDDLRDLVPGFLARKRDDAAAVVAAAERGAREAVARLGHKLKGEGGGFGLEAISEIGRGLERAAAGGDFDGARRLAGELVDFLDRLQIVYQPMEE
jgi:PAS domain S-box-containing protein